MGKKLLDNSDNVQTWYEYDELTGDQHITYEQDVGGFLDAIAGKRSQDRWKKEVKDDFVHFASIPPIVELELLKKGLNLYDKNATKKIMQEIQTNYPHLLAHAGKKLA